MASLLVVYRKNGTVWAGARNNVRLEGLIQAGMDMRRTTGIVLAWVGLFWSWLECGLDIVALACLERLDCSWGAAVMWERAEIQLVWRQFSDYKGKWRENTETLLFFWTEGEYFHHFFFSNTHFPSLRLWVTDAGQWITQLDSVRNPAGVWHGDSDQEVPSVSHTVQKRACLGWLEIINCQILRNWVWAWIVYVSYRLSISWLPPP